MNQELKTIELYNRLISAPQYPVAVHRIEAQDMLASLGRSSKLNADWDFLNYLHDLGTQAATDFISSNYSAIGSTRPAASSAA